MYDCRKKNRTQRKFIMKNLIRASALLGLFAVSGVLFYFQPTAEAKTVFDTTDNLQRNIQQQIIQQNNTQQQFNPELQQVSNIKQQEIQQVEKTDSEENNEYIAESRSFRATAYCLQGRTANGGSVRRGIVAADSRILPLGTRIEVNAGAYSGTYTVTDTGGAIKGRILDIWVPNCLEAKRFGHKKVTVSVLQRKNKNRS